MEAAAEQKKKNWTRGLKELAKKKHVKMVRRNSCVGSRGRHGSSPRKTTLTICVAPFQGKRSCGRSTAKLKIRNPDWSRDQSPWVQSHRRSNGKEGDGLVLTLRVLSQPTVSRVFRKAKTTSARVKQSIFLIFNFQYGTSRSEQLACPCSEEWYRAGNVHADSVVTGDGIARHNLRYVSDLTMVSPLAISSFFSSTYRPCVKMLPSDLGSRVFGNILML